MQKRERSESSRSDDYNVWVGDICFRVRAKPELCIAAARRAEGPTAPQENFWHEKLSRGRQSSVQKTK